MRVFKRNKHKHQWIAFRALQGTLKTLLGGGHPVTQVYFKCSECRELTMKQYDGLWELEDFV